LGFSSISDSGGTSIIVGPGWLGQHQLVGGASLELRRGRKIDYLDIPIKDSIKGRRLEWFIVENHGNPSPSVWEATRRSHT
jgi:hypothetical protein